MARLIRSCGIAFTSFLGSNVAEVLENGQTSRTLFQRRAGEEEFMSRSGIVDIPSQHSLDETVDRLKALLHAKGVTLFAVIDHSGEATKVGLALPPTKLLIFGNPKAGTPVMVAAPTSAIDLPLKILVAEDAHGKVSITYNATPYLQERHEIPPELVANIAGVEALAKTAAE
jgi:uncharacterized protein (DUF302 family)